jgi:hypothetical protein
MTASSSAFSSCRSGKPWPVPDCLSESLTIVGWVAMWRPLQIFLYDWWPLQRQIRLYQKLSSAHIQVIQGKLEKSRMKNILIPTSLITK